MPLSSSEAESKDDDIRFILENALYAPSGDNTQPWHWVVRGDTLELLNESDQNEVLSLYSGQSVDFTLGTAIENVVIAASARGYRAGISYFPDPAHPRFVARISLLKDAQLSPDILSSVLFTRVTNRNPYHREPLTSGERATLLAANVDEAFGTIKFIEDRKSVDTIAKIASLHDELLFSIKDLHKHMFALINWTKREDARRRIGFYFPTLAAPPFTWGGMQLLRHWWIMRLGIVFSLHRLIALEQRQVYRHTGAYGVVLTRGDTPSHWMNAGRLLERLWLTANAAGLDLHPMNGVLFFALNTETEEGLREFSPEQRQRLKDGREEIAHIFGVESKTIAFMFRIGHGKPPSARTSRLPFEKMVTIVSSASISE